MAGYIDIHTHAFPDEIARFAIPALERDGRIKAYLDGTVDSLLASMDRSGVERSVVCTIATPGSEVAPPPTFFRKFSSIFHRIVSMLLAFKILYFLL